jgi:hypothetical protein
MERFETLREIARTTATSSYFVLLNHRVNHFTKSGPILLSMTCGACRHPSSRLERTNASQAPQTKSIPGAVEKRVLALTPPIAENPGSWLSEIG